MREFGIFVGLMIAGAIAGISYAYLTADQFTVEPAAVVEAPESPKKRKSASARTKSEKKNRIARARPRMTKTMLRAGAAEFFARIDSLGCALDPVNRDLIVDEARYSMIYRLVDGSEKTLEMSGAEYKAFGLEPSRELNISELECSKQGRFYKVENAYVRVHEQRSLAAKQDGRTVRLQIDRTLLVGPNAAGAWVIHEIAGKGTIRK